MTRFLPHIQCSARNWQPLASIGAPEVSRSERLPQRQCWRRIIYRSGKAEGSMSRSQWISSERRITRCSRHKRPSRIRSSCDQQLPVRQRRKGRGASEAIRPERSVSQASARARARSGRRTQERAEGVSGHRRLQQQWARTSAGLSGSQAATEKRLSSKQHGPPWGQGGPSVLGDRLRIVLQNPALVGYVMKNAFSRRDAPS